MVSISVILKMEMVLKTVELNCLSPCVVRGEKWGNFGVGNLMDRNKNGWGIQFFGSSWAKKMIGLRTKADCVWFFYFFQMYCQYSAVGVLCKILGFVVKYYFGVSVRRSEVCVYIFVELKIRGDYYASWAKYDRL